MLRRPSAFPTSHDEKGCSSTAFAEKSYVNFEVWNNRAGRRSSKSTYDFSAALL